MIETLIYLVVALIILGAALYLLNMLVDVIPMDPRIKQAIKVLILVVVVLIVLLRVVLPLLNMAV